MHFLALNDIISNNQKHTTAFTCIKWFELSIIGTEHAIMQN